MAGAGVSILDMYSAEELGLGFRLGGSYVNVNEMLDSSGVEHCESSDHKAHSYPGNWAERDAAALEEGV